MRLLAVILAASLCAASWASAQQNGVRVATRGAQRDVAVMLDQAVILESARSFSELQIAQPGIADVQPLSDRSIYLLGRSIGRTSLALLDASGRVIENLRVVVEPDLSELKQRLRELLPRERVEVRAAGDGLILSGSVGGAAAIDRAMALGRAYAGDRVTNLMTVGAMQQVSLVVRLAEMNRTAAKEIGVSLGASRTGDPSVGVATGGTNILPGGGVDLPAYTGFGALGTLFSIGDSLLLGLQIDALETKGFARTLAEPNLVALSGGEAEFLAGGEVPIPLINNDGEVDVEFRPIGVSLAFRPTVLEDDAISIAVSSEVADIDPSLGAQTAGLSIPGFTVRRATTQVELRDGQSFAIAGLYQDDFADTVSQVPWLGEIPVLGALFRSADFQRGETELIIVVTARLVNPVEAADAIATPFERVSLPNEADLFLFGRTDGRSAPEFDGPYGYVLD
ncbi:type II and III secretion system protein family protein [Rubrimonas sp.]|uniref:type II and III secretion system protein family protein n=1 Tax=Rubrimonas sp. TaxID=2036015 RepID=UPI002FDE289D